MTSVIAYPGGRPFPLRERLYLVNQDLKVHISRALNLLEICVLPNLAIILHTHYSYKYLNRFVSIYS